MELAVGPVDIASVGGSCELAFTEELEGQLSAEMKEAVENGVHSSFLQGKWTKLIFSFVKYHFHDLKHTKHWNVPYFR